MNDWYDEPPRAERHGSLDVRELLEEASWTGWESTVEPHEVWADGRRRRQRRRLGAGVVASVATVAAMGLVWQTGVFGGTAGEQEPHVATVPSGMTTFVLAAPDAPDVDPATISALRVPTPEELNGTSWTLTDQVLGSDRSAAAIIGSRTETVFSFDERSWGFLADGCGGAGDQAPVRIAEDGSFAPPRELASDDQGCPEPAQTAEDFWTGVLPEGGTLHRLGEHWLLLSVDVGESGVAQPAPVVEGTGEASGTPRPTPDETADVRDPAPSQATPTPATPPTPAAPTPASPTPATPTPPAPTPQAPGPATPPPGPVVGPSPAPAVPSPAPSAPSPGSSPPATVPEQPSEAEPGSILAGFSTPTTVATSAGWPGSGGDLLAPTVRAGANDGFDRVVLDLTGTSTPTWRARYTDDPVRDGSGLPAQVAGDTVLELVVTGMAYPEPGDPVYDGGDFGLDTHRLDGIYEVIRTTPFEGQLQLFVGVAGEARPYRVFLLQDPLRLVVDVQHPG